jgi:hypothetical protein
MNGRKEGRRWGGREGGTEGRTYQPKFPMNIVANNQGNTSKENPTHIKRSVSVI